MEIKTVILAVFGIYIAMVLTSSLAPSALTGISVTSINTTNWSAGLISTFGSVSILYGVALLFIPIAIVLKMID